MYVDNHDSLEARYQEAVREYQAIKEELEETRNMLANTQAELIRVTLLLSPQN